MPPACRTDRFARVWIPLLILIAATAIGPESLHAQTGPLRIGERNPLYDLSYTPYSEGADLTEAGRFSATFGTSYSNIFEYEHNQRLDLQLDTERMINEVVLRYGLHERLEVGGRVALRTDWGGRLDRFIETFHHAFHLPNGGRGAVEQQQVRIHLSYGDTASISVARAAGSLEDLRLFAKVRLLGRAEDDRALSLRVAGKLPTGSSITSTGATDIGLDLLARRSFAPWHIHAQVGAVRFQPIEGLDAYARGGSLSAGMGIEREVGKGWAVLSQLLAGTPYYGGFGERELDRPPINLAFGTIYKSDSDWKFEFAVTEDLPGNNPAVDASLSIAVQHEF